MNKYVFVLSFIDDATRFIGVTPVDIVAKSPEDATLKLEAHKRNREWLKTIPMLDVRDDEDLAGIVVGEHLLISETIAPPDSPELALALQNEACALSHSRKHAEARQLLERSLAILETTHGPGGTELAPTLELLGRELVALRDPERAIALHERSIAIREAAKEPLTNIAFARFLLARALWRAFRDTARGVDVAKAAREALGAHATREAAEIDEWIRSHDHTCKTCGWRYAPDEELASDVSSVDAPDQYADGVDDHCLTCWLGLGPYDVERDLNKHKRRSEYPRTGAPEVTPPRAVAFCAPRHRGRA